MQPFVTQLTNKTVFAVERETKRNRAQIKLLVICVVPCGWGASVGVNYDELRSRHQLFHPCHRVAVVVVVVAVVVVVVTPVALSMWS
jgi:hypothetical protein